MPLGGQLRLTCCFPAVCAGGEPGPGGAHAGPRRQAGRGERRCVASVCPAACAQGCSVPLTAQLDRLRAGIEQKESAIREEEKKAVLVCALMRACVQLAAIP